MQSYEWYMRRLRAMSPGEVLWRVRNRARQVLDRPLAPLRRRPPALWKIATAEGAVWTVRPEAIGRELPGVGGTPDWLPQFADWKAALLDRAERIARNRLTLFDLEDHDLGPEIDWNYEYKARRKTPLKYAADIDYRDYAEVGDCKFAWEPSRHYHLVTLARAYRVSGERAFAQAVVEQMESWMDACPYGLGMQWRSPLELGIRMINWVWALELIRPAGLISPVKEPRILGCVYRHLWEISRNYSRYSSANNHLIGEAAGVFIAASYFAGLKHAPAWRREARAILLREIARQTYEDGGTREQALGYHLFVLEFLLLAGLVARNRAEDFPAEYWARLERMFEFLCGMVEGGEDAPMFGDADDGYVLDLGGGRPSPRELLAVGAALFGRGDFKLESQGPADARSGADGEAEANAGAGFSEQAFWLLGKSGYERYGRVRIQADQTRIASRSFPASGYYLLQFGRRGSADRVSVLFDCGELGFGPIAAHGHADALSFTLRAFGRDIFVDPGTYDYFTYGPWREYFRSTRAHNTVVVDDRDQSEMLGPFLWGRRANARCTRWEVNDSGATVAGEHDGYASSAPEGGIIHRRNVSLSRTEGILTIHDELSGSGAHSATWYFHLAEGCSVRREGNRFLIGVAGRTLTLELDPELVVTMAEGAEAPIAGWVSRGYHRKTPCVTLIARREWEHRLVILTRVQMQFELDTSDSSEYRQ